MFIIFSKWAQGVIAFIAMRLTHFLGDTFSLVRPMFPLLSNIQNLQEEIRPATQ
jgi:hypothetical protein